MTNQGDETVTVVDLNERIEISQIDVGDYPEGIAFITAHDQFFVADWYSNSVSVIDAESLELIDEIACGNGSRAFGEFVMQ